MTEQEFYQLLKRRLSQISIGASAIRNQGAGGLIKKLRDYFENEVDLEQFSKCLSNEYQYKEFLDVHTLNILEKFPENAKSWGAARKGLNLFLREIVYNKFFSHLFKFPENFNDFNSLVKYMEVPLDKEVVTGLINDSNRELPKWERIKNLTPASSNIYQNYATMIASKKNIARINLDLIYWRPDLEKTNSNSNN